LRQKPIFEVLGLLFDVSKTKGNDTFNYWLDILRDILPSAQIEAVAGDTQKYFVRQLLTEYQLIVNSALNSLLQDLWTMSYRKITILVSRKCIL
jgi:hypothetical protein